MKQLTMLSKSGNYSKKRKQRDDSDIQTLIVKIFQQNLPSYMNLPNLKQKQWIQILSLFSITLNSIQCSFKRPKNNYYIRKIFSLNNKNNNNNLNYNFHYSIFSFKSFRQNSNIKNIQTYLMQDRVIQDLIRSTQKSIPAQLFEKSTHNPLIQNYYGAHKTFKTQFRNKRYRNVYNQLIHRKPAQEEYAELYYQDFLASIIKSVQKSVLYVEKDNAFDSIHSIEPFFYFGQKSIKDYYWLFLKQRRIIDGQLLINPQKKYKISYYFTLVIDFCTKICFYLKKKGDYRNAQKIMKNCYQLMVQKIIDSSTSNTRLLKKIVQFLLVYSIFCQEIGPREKGLKLLDQALKILLNILIIHNLKINRNCENSFLKYKKRCIKAESLLVQVLLCIAIYKQEQGKYIICKHLLNGAIQIEKQCRVYHKKKRMWCRGLQKNFENSKELQRQIELQKICKVYFSIKNIQQNVVLSRKPASMFPYNFSIGLRQLKKMYPKAIHNKKQNIFSETSSITQKNNLRKTNKQVRFKITDSQILEKNKRCKEASIQNVASQLGNVLSKEQIDSIKILKSKKMLVFESSYKNISVENQIFNRLETVEDFRSLLKSNEQQQKKVSKNRVKSCYDINNFNANAKAINQQQNTQNKSKSTKSLLQNSNQKNGRNLLSNMKKNLKRKINYEEKKYIQCQKQQWKKKMKQKEQIQKTKIKKKSNKQRTFTFQIKKNKNKQNIALFQNINTVAKKLSNWHDNAITIDVEMNVKKQRLRQKHNQKPVFSLNLQEQFGQTIKHQNQLYDTFQNIDQENTKRDIISQFEENKIAKQKDSQKLTGINLFKKIILEHKKRFGIIKPEYFQVHHVVKSFQRNQRRKGTKLNKRIKESFIQSIDDENKLELYHKQAEKNVKFFMKEYQRSLGIKPGQQVMKLNERTEKSRYWRPKNQLKNKQQIQIQNLYNMGNNNPRSYDNLFTSSLKSKSKSIKNDMLLGQYL